MIAIGFTGISGDLLSGFLNDAFFAFQQLDHFDRRSDMGPYHPAMERFHATGAAPYNVQAIFTFITVLWDSRGYTSAQAKFRNGAGGLRLGYSIFRGGLITLVYTPPTGLRKMLTDYLEAIHWRISQTERDVIVQIGDGEAEQVPIAKLAANITGLQEGANVLTLAPRG